MRGMTPHATPSHDDTPKRRKLRLITLGFALGALAMVIFAGPLTRAGLPWRLGLSLLPLGAGIALAVVIAALVQIVVPKWRRPGPYVLLAALVAATLALLPPLMLRAKAQGVPPIHDITTDAMDAPAFVALLPARKDSANGADYRGAEVHGLQRAAYADIQPLVLKEKPDRVFQRALDAARALGWDVAASDAKSGRIEATDTTFWWGFKDDVVIRVRPEGEGSRVDVRSMSRVGRSDLGANAARVRAFLARLR
jgi:uncharacterized protein (DUF1499 family)